MKTFKCCICGENMEKLNTRGRDPVICTKPECKRLYAKEATQRYRRRKAEAEGRSHRVDIGKGGGQMKGKDSPSYKNGIKYFHDNAKRIKDERRCCEECGKDLSTANRYQWCVHHIDHDRTNNDDSNFQLLCKRCHQIEHECWKAFEGSTTIP